MPLIRRKRLDQGAGIETGTNMSNSLATADTARASLVFAAESFEVRNVLSRISGILREADFHANDVMSLELVLAEVLNNVVEHAYAEGPGGKISLQLNWSDSELHCVVADAGSHMPDHRLPDGMPQDPSVGVQDLPEGGFGWQLIRENVRDLHYEWTVGTNMITFAFDRQ